MVKRSKKKEADGISSHFGVKYLTQETTAPVSAFAALKSKEHPSRSSADGHALNEISESSQWKVENEELRPFKRRAMPGQPQKSILPLTQNSSSHQNTPITLGAQPSNVNIDKDETFDKNGKHSPKATLDMTTRPASGLDRAEPQDNWQDRKPAFLIHTLTLYSSDSEIDVLLQGPEKQLSTFTPTKDNVIGETAEEWTIHLKEADRLTLLGQYEIWVRKGAIAVMGAVIHAGSTVHRVHAPSTHSLPVIRACQNPFMPDDQTAEITILSLSTTGIRHLRELSPRFDRIWNHRCLAMEQTSASVDLSQRSFIYLKSSADDIHQRPLHPVEYPVYWQREINRIRNPFRKYPAAVMVCGPKGTGKSTFCRILANSLLSTRVNSTTTSYGFAKRDHLGANGIAFLDLDPGQPEFSPPGEVTLMYMRRFNLGVPYTHPIIGISEPNRLIRAHHLGAVSPNDNPEHYQNCALDLFRHYFILLLEDPSCPLIVNCSGWVTARGLEVLVRLIQQMSLTDIVCTTKVGGPPEVATILGEAAAQAGTHFQLLAAQQPALLNRTPSDLRVMQALSYFHLDKAEGIHLRWNPSPLNEVAPLTVRYSGASQDIFAIMILGEEQDPELYGYLLEGSVVGVVALEDNGAIIGVQTDGQLGSVGAITLEDNSAVIEAPEEGQLGDVGACPEDVVGKGEIQSGDGNYNDRFKFPHASRLGSTSDGETDDDNMAESDGSNFGRPWRPSRKFPAADNLSMQPSRSTNTAVEHPFVSRTPEGLPYLYTGAGIGVQAALDPSKSYSIGQALIRGIDPSSQTIHLYSPIPQATFQQLARRKAKVVLVRGAMDTPTWAFMEEFVAMTTQRKRGRSAGGGRREKVGAWEMKEWAEGVPWAAFKDGREERSSARVRHSRRNLRTG